VANSPLVLSHDMIDTSHQIESGGNVHDIMTHPGWISYDWSLRAFAHASVRWFLFWLIFSSGQAFSRFHIFLCNFFGNSGLIPAFS